MIGRINHIFKSQWSWNAPVFVYIAIVEMLKFGNGKWNVDVIDSANQILVTGGVVGTFTWVLIPSLFSLRLVWSSLVWELMMTMLRMAKDYVENDFDNVDDHNDDDDNDDFQRQLLASASASASAYWQQLLPTVTTQQQLFFIIICYIMMTVIDDYSDDDYSIRCLWL